MSKPKTMYCIDITYTVTKRVTTYEEDGGLACVTMCENLESEYDQVDFVSAEVIEQTDDYDG